MGSRTQESRGLGQTDIVTVFVTCQALTQSPQNREVGTVLAILSTGNKRTQVQQHAQDPRPRSGDTGIQPRLLAQVGDLTIEAHFSLSI